MTFKVNVPPNNMMSLTSSKENFLIEVLFYITKFSSFKLSNLRMQAKLSEGSFVSGFYDVRMLGFYLNLLVSKHFHLR